MSHRLLPAIAAVLIPIVAQAQQPAPLPAEPTIPQPPQPAGTPAAMAQPRSAGTPVRLEFPNADVRDVLAFYGRLANKKIIYDNTVQGQITVSINDTVSEEEAIRILEKSFLINGFSLIPDEDGVVKVVGLTKNPRQVGVPIISSEAEIPETDQVVSFLFKLQYADPTEVSQMVSLYVAPSLYTSVAALPKAQAILITESSPVLRGLVRLIREIDVPPAEVESAFIPLERADAKDVIEKLEKIFEKQPNQQGAPGATQPAGAQPRMAQGVEGQPPEQPPGVTINQESAAAANRLKEDSIIVGKIRLTADVRTNRIHVVTRPVNLPFIRKLIQEFDSDVKFGEPTVRVLKYVSADDVLDVVVKSIAEKGEKTDETQTGQSKSNTQQTSASTSMGGGLQGSSGYGAGYGGSSSGGMNVSEGLSTQAKDTVPKAITVGNTRIIADLRNNSIIVMGNEEAKQKIFRVLDELDNRAPQVMLRTVIGELSLSDQFNFSFNYFLGNGDINRTTNNSNSNNNNNNGNNNNGGVTINNNGSSSLSSRSGISIGNSGVPAVDFLSLMAARGLNNKLTPVAVGGATGLNAFVTAGDSLGAVVSALKSTGRFRTVQSPVVFASNNKKAIIASGEEIAVPTQTLSSLTNGNLTTDNTAVTSSIQYKQVALQLEVVPLVNSDREVALDILQKLDSQTGQSTTVAGSQVPTIATRYIRTNVSVPNGATIALGGLIKNEKQISNGGIPYLMDIPGVGFLFKSKTKSDNRSELIILMKPEVVNAPNEMLEATERQQERLNLEPDLGSTLDASAKDRAKTVKMEAVPTTTKVTSDRKANAFSK